MKKLAIIFLILIVLIQCSMKTGIVAYYKINKDYITANFCENKSNKSMHCDGKCYLIKKIKAQEEREKNSFPSVLNGLEEIVLFCSSIEISVPYPAMLFKILLNNIYFVRQYDSPALTIFQPPQ